MASRGEHAAFGALLRRHRETAGLTQEALAERAGLSARAISDLERGINRAPRGDTLGLLIRALDLAGPDRSQLEAAARRHDESGASAPPGADLPRDDALSLVGRAAELALLDRYLAGEGRPVLLLAGEPGVGKSRLLRHVLQRAPALGWQVFHGGCQRRGGQEPYAPLQEAVEHYLQQLLPAVLRAGLEGCAWLVRLLPELAEGPIEPLPRWQLSPDQERRLMFRAVARLLANAAGPAGTLLVLDDLQWAGADALDLLAALLRADPPPRVLAAYRDTEVAPAHPLAAAMADLAQAGLAHHHTLGPLAPAEAERLLDTLLAGVAGDRAALGGQIAARAGGIPFFLKSLAEALRVSGRAEIPWDLAQSIRVRVAALPTAAQEVLRAAATIGRVAPRNIVVAVAGRPRDELSTALDAACRARLLEEEGAGAYHFTHDLVREVVDAELGAAQRALLHRRVAEALETMPGHVPLDVLAYHYDQSGEQEKAGRFLEQAGDRAWSQFAHGAAMEHFENAISRLDDLGRAPEAARVREKVARVLETEARYGEALAALERAAEQFGEAQDMEGLGRVGAAIGWIHARRRTTAAGLARVRPLVAVIEASGQARCLAPLYVALAYLLLGGGCYAELGATAERAADLAREEGDDRALVEAEIMRASAHVVAGRLKSGQEILEGAVATAEKARDLRGLCWSLLELSYAYLTRGQLEQCRQCAERGYICADRLGDAHWIAIATNVRGICAVLRGDWPLARRDFERAVDIGRTHGAPLAAFRPLRELASLCLAEGRWEDAGRRLTEALRLAEGFADPAAIRDVQLVLAEQELLEGEPQQARARLEPLVTSMDQQHLSTTECLPRLAWAYLDLGEIARAEELADRAVAQARADGWLLALLDALRMQAMVAIRAERWCEAERSLEEGLILARGMRQPYAEGRLLYAFSTLHMRRGDPGPARERLAAALAIFRRLGARNDVERAERDLAAVARAQQPSWSRAAPVPGY